MTFTFPPTHTHAAHLQPGWLDCPSTHSLGPPFPPTNQRRRRWGPERRGERLAANRLAQRPHPTLSFPPSLPPSVGWVGGCVAIHLSMRSLPPADREWTEARSCKHGRVCVRVSFTCRSQPGPRTNGRTDGRTANRPSARNTGPGGGRSVHLPPHRKYTCVYISR